MKTTLCTLLAALATAGCSPSSIDAVTTVALGEAGVVPTMPMDASADARVKPTGAGLHTSGTQIVDKDGKPFVIRAVTWYGLDYDFYPHGLNALTIDDILSLMKKKGFNTIRLAWSSEMLHTTSKPQSINYTVNPDLVGVKTPRDLLDTVIVHAEALGLKIILSRRRASAGSSPKLWWDGTYGPEKFVEDWLDLAAQYRGRSSVIGCDLESDLRGETTWGDNNPNTDWKAAAEHAGSEILLHANADVLIFVEGIETVGTASYWEGGNLQGVGTAPITLAVPNHLVYATQDFPVTFPDLPKQGIPSWFSDPSYPMNLPQDVWDPYWGFVFEKGIAPVFIAGFGTAYMNPSDILWLSQLTAYMKQNALGFAYYALDEDAPGGLYLDYATSTLNEKLMTALGPILTP